MSPLFRGAQCGQTTADVLQSGLSSQEDSLTSPDVVVMLPLVQSGFSWLPIFQRYFTGSCSTRYSPGSAGPLLQCNFSAKHHLACTGEYLGFFPPQGQDLAFAFAWL